MMLLKPYLPVPVSDYAEWFCLLHLWAYIFKDVGALELL